MSAMRLNREKVVTILAAVIFLAGLYQVVVGIVTPRPDIRVPDVSLDESHREIGAPRYRRFTADKPPSRNPFSFSEGWRRLDSLPLDAPPVPAMGWLLPLPARLPQPTEGGFRYLEKPPVDASGPRAEGSTGGAR